MKCIAVGPVPAEIMIIGEAPGANEEEQGVPFVGASGSLLDKLLATIGLVRSSCFVTNVCRFRPPDNEMDAWISDRKTSPDPSWVLLRNRWVHPNVKSGYEELLLEIEQVQPKLIIALGNTALWTLTGEWGIAKWRASRLSVPDIPCPIIPMFHPAAVLREENLMPVARMDFKRAKAIYEGTQNPRLYKFIIAPTFEQAKEGLEYLFAMAEEGPIRMAGDLETRRGHIACFGIAWSENEAICIPFLKTDGDSPFYWTEGEESALVESILRLFRHPNIIWDGQNYLYDCQYFYRFWGTLPLNVFDTMIGHHSIFSNMRKGLDFLSSMYAQDHVYWKEESKDWDKDLGEKQLWTYNCKDCCITWEVSPEIRADHQSQGRDNAYRAQHFKFQQSLFFPVLRMMNRGCRIDTKERAHLRKILIDQQYDRQEKLNYLAGHELNPRSSKQLINFFYKDLKLPVIRALQSESITTNSPAMVQISMREPALKPLCQLIVELRSLGVFLSTFIDAGLDSDGKMRCSFAIAGPTTFRFSSSENAFGSGMNLQNIPVAEKAKIKDDDYIKLPNIRKLFIPDPGHTFFDMDLDRADLQVVVWEANDSDLKLALREELDMHCVNACVIFDIQGIPFDELKESHPNFKEHRAKIGKAARDKAKVGVHATNYGVGDRKLATSLNISVHEASKFRTKWFAAHPGIHKWHKRTEQAVMQYGYLENLFGARLYKLGRFDLPEFLGWYPQSTVAAVINRALVNIDAAEQRGEIQTQLLIQVHDSLAGQFPTEAKAAEIARLRELSKIAIPYEEPLIIPVGFKTSEKSWGDCS